MSEDLNTVAAEIKAKLDNTKRMGELFAALAKAQGQFSQVAKNRSVKIKMNNGGEFKFDYADLEQLIHCTRPALSANGLAVLQIVAEGELHTKLVHASGAEIGSTMKLPAMGQDPKAYGAALTYLRRYSYASLLCLAADDDLDEDGREAGPITGGPKSAEPAKRPAPKAEAADDGAMASQGEINYAKAKLGKLDSDTALALLAKHGIKGLDQGVTKAAFDALKADLLKGA